MNIFIGSSSQATDQLLEIADIVKKSKNTPIPWNQHPAPFEVGRFTLESLENMVQEKNIGAAIFIYRSDDETWFDDQRLGTPRDNVIFEHGLFMGKLGRTRSIIIKYDDVELPTDLSGYTYIDFHGDNRYSGEIELNNWLAQLQKGAPQHNAHDNNVLMLPRNEIHDRYSIDSRLHISDGLYKQIQNIRIMNFASNLVINPEMADPTHVADDRTKLSLAIEKIMKETEAKVALILSEPNKYNLKDLETKIVNQAAGSPAETLITALERMHEKLSTETIYKKRSLRPQRFFFYLMKTSMPYAIFNVEFIGEASLYNHVKVDLYSAALKTENDRRSFVIWQSQDPNTYQFFVDNFIYIQNNNDLCKLQTCESLGKHVKRAKKLLNTAPSGG